MDVPIDSGRLVVESAGFKEEQSWLDDDAHPHSDVMTVAERWWRPDFNHLAHEVTVTDPKYYSRPFTFDRVFEHMPPGQELIEYACTENNRDVLRLGFGPHEPGIYDKPQPARKQESSFKSRTLAIALIPVTSTDPHTAPNLQIAFKRAVPPTGLVEIGKGLFRGADIRLLSTGGNTFFIRGALHSLI